MDKSKKTKSYGGLKSRKKSIGDFFEFSVIYKIHHVFHITIYFLLFPLPRIPADRFPSCFSCNIVRYLRTPSQSLEEIARVIFKPKGNENCKKKIREIFKISKTRKNQCNFPHFNNYLEIHMADFLQTSRGCS